MGHPRSPCSQVKNTFPILALFTTVAVIRRTVMRARVRKEDAAVAAAINYFSIAPSFKSRLYLYLNEGKGERMNNRNVMLHIKQKWQVLILDSSRNACAKL